MKSQLSLILTCTLVGCAGVPLAERETSTTSIIVYRVSLEEINKLCFRAPYGSTPNNIGCAYFNPSTVGRGGICTIYIPAPAAYADIFAIRTVKNLKGAEDTPAARLSLELHILGHEVKHCLEGAWH